MTREEAENIVSEKLRSMTDEEFTQLVKSITLNQDRSYDIDPEDIGKQEMEMLVDNLMTISEITEEAEESTDNTGFTVYELRLPSGAKGDTGLKVGTSSSCAPKDVIVQDLANIKDAFTRGEFFFVKLKAMSRTLGTLGGLGGESYTDCIGFPTMIPSCSMGSGIFEVVIPGYDPGTGAKCVRVSSDDSMGTTFSII